MKEFSKFYLPTEYFNDVCRVCLSKHNVLILIEEINLTHNLKLSGSVENVNLKTVFEKFCNVKVEASDNKPQMICEFCITMGCKAFNFFQLFLYSNTLLDKKLEENKLSQEKSEPNEGEGNRNNVGLVPELCSDNLMSNKENTAITNDGDVMTSDGIIDNEGADPNSPALPPQNIERTGDQRKKRKSTYRPHVLPHKWLDSNGILDPIKRRALRLLLKLTNKTIPTVREKRTPICKPKAIRLRQIQHQNNIFQCKFCREMFHDINKVIDHLKDKHADTKICVLCPAKFRRTESLFYHVARHSPKALVCSICRLYFENKESLDIHKEIVDHTYNKTCPKCGKTFKRRCDLGFHLDSVHFKKEKYQCKLCGKMFRYDANMRRHEENTHGNRRFLCQVCGIDLSTLYQLKVHMQRVHKLNQGVAIKKYPANKGGWMSRDPRARRTPREVKFECQYCPKKFFNSYGFYIHSEIHPEFKEYRCEVCKEVLETRSEYVKHSRTHEVFKCPFPSCVRMFPTEKAAFHHKHAHKQHFSCTVCHRKFRLRMQLDVHTNVHTGERPYKCEQCGQGFKQKQHLDVHKVSIHGGKKKWQCQLCDKAFSYISGLRCHMRSHRGEKPFPCPFCKKMFRDTTGRHKHVKRDHPKKMNEFLVYKQDYQDQEILRVERESEKTEKKTDTDSNSDDGDEQ